MSLGKPRIKILLVDEHSLFRDAVRAALGGESDLQVVADAGDGRLAVSEAERTRPDVTLLDASIRRHNGVGVIASIRERVPKCRVLVLAPQEDQATLLEILEAGASGYLTKCCPLQELIAAARAVHDGETLIPRRMLGPLLAGLIERRREQDDALRLVSRLTPREREVLALLTGSAANDSIAKALVISPETARTHIQNILTKLGVHSRMEAAALVMRTGILDELTGSDPTNVQLLPIAPIPARNVRRIESGATRG